MKELSSVNQKVLRNDANGATVQLRTEENQIVVFSVSSKGTTCSFGSKSVRIPTKLARTTSLNNLLVQLKKGRFSVKGGSLSLVGSRIGNIAEGVGGGECGLYIEGAASGKKGGVMEDTCSGNVVCGGDAACGADSDGGCGGWCGVESPGRLGRVGGVMEVTCGSEGGCGEDVPLGCPINVSGRLGGVGKPSIKPSLKKTK